MNLQPGLLRFAGRFATGVNTRSFGYVSRDDLAPGLRMAALDRFVIFFRVLDGVVRVERVLHGARKSVAFFLLA